MRAGRRRWLPMLTVFLVILLIGTTVIAAPYGSRSLYAGRVGTDVAELQSQLNSLGYSAGAADGAFGSRTGAAVSQFQTDAGLLADGVAEQWEFQALNRAAAYQRATAYTLAPGDTLESVALAHGTTVETLIWLNRLTSDQVQPGQELRIPNLDQPPALPPTRAPEPQPVVDATPQPAPAPPTATQPAPAPDARPGQRWLLPSLVAPGYLVINPPPPPQESSEPLPAGQRIVVGYYAEDWQGDPRSLDSLRTAGKNVDMVVNFQLQLDGAGNLASRPYPELLAEAGARGIKLYGLVHNLNANGFDKEVARAVLGDAAVRSHAVEQILQAARSFGLAGIDIDIENAPPEQRENYTALVRELAGRLKPEGFGLSISIPAKTFDDRSSSWSGAYDYAALGQYADRVAIMSYDEHSPGWGAGPVASLGWVERVAAYATSQIEPQKLLLGIGAYGYDWEVGATAARGLSAPGAAALAERHGAPVQWDAVAQVPYFTYSENGSQRIVYFENAASTAAKLDLVGKYQLAGIAIWRLGLEDPGIWPVIAAKLR